MLAATLSGLYGIYSGFELLEHRRIGRTEEYVDSEKYEIVVRDWDAAGNLKPLIETLNRLRRTWPALQRTETLRFEAVRGKRTLFYRKALPVGRLDLLSEEPKRWRQPVGRGQRFPTRRSGPSAPTWPRWGSIRSVPIGTRTC